MNTAQNYDMIDTPTYQDDETMVKSTYSMNISDLMGEDHYLWISKNKKHGFDIEIENEDGELVVKEEGIHPYAMESFYLFCKRFISVFESQCEEAKNV